MEASSQSPPSITDHFKKRKKATSQRLRISKSKLDVNLSENKINDDNLSTESNSTHIRQKLNRQKSLIDNKKIRKKLNRQKSLIDNKMIRKKLNRQTSPSDINSSTESNSTKKRRKTVRQKSPTDKLDGENTEVELEIRKKIWDILDRSLRETDGDLAAELERSRKESSDVSGAVGSPGKEQSTLRDLDESIIKNVSYEEKESSVVAVTQSNESGTEEISFSEVHCSSSYEFDESILRNVSSENLAGPSGYGIPSTENKTQRNVHSLSSSCDSSFNTELNSPELISAIIEDSLNDSTHNNSDLKVSENKAIIISDEAVEIEKSSDLNKADVSNLEEFPIKWECEELEQSFSDLVDDLEKIIDEDQLTSTPKKRKPQPPDATSPTKKEKYSPHIVKSPKKYFGSSAKRKLIKDNQNSSPSSSSKTKSKGSSTVTSNSSKTNNFCGSQKLISEYFPQSKPESKVGTELKEAIGRRNSVDSPSRNSDDSKIFPLHTSAHLKIFEDCLQHIQKVILPVERYLFTEDEILFLKSVEDLNISAKCLYFRLLVRKHSWIRRSKINYDELNSSLDNDLKKLEEFGLLSSDYNEEDIYILLELLTNPELRKLCRSFRVGDQGNKCSLILNLTKMSDKQSTLDGKNDSHFLIRKAGEMSF
ncbi:fanconi-associated nuclease 1-like isoform X2 [Nilaparvata lugens]|uniref:fanconi-associated nuclease 1-like isoform X2 n=1 Tax=Nilaparvata lugens TaxID=108931 RepID=UPI00193E0ADE|nr:fanconi-associated nuclease 1-like isoform X2 [Nilaparvata lugens]